MATSSKKGKYLYEANDLVDDFLFNEVTKHLNVDKIGVFGPKIDEDLPFEPLTVEGQTQRVSTIPVKMYFVDLCQIDPNPVMHSTGFPPIREIRENREIFEDFFQSGKSVFSQNQRKEFQIRELFQNHFQTF